MGSGLWVQPFGTISSLFEDLAVSGNYAPTDNDTNETPTSLTEAKDTFLTNHNKRNRAQSLFSTMAPQEHRTRAAHSDLAYLPLNRNRGCGRRWQILWPSSIEGLDRKDPRVGSKGKLTGSTFRKYVVFCLIMYVEKSA